MYKATVTGKRQITIPIEICEKLKIVSGNQIEFIIEGNKIIFKKCEYDKEDICPYCNKLVYKGSNHVNFEGRNYHMNCWYDNK